MFEDGCKRRRALCSHHRISTAVTAGAAGGGSDAQVICCASPFPLFSPVRLPRHRCQCSAGDVGSVQYTIVGFNTLLQGAAARTLRVVSARCLRWGSATCNLKQYRKN